MPTNLAEQGSKITWGHGNRLPFLKTSLKSRKPTGYKSGEVLKTTLQQLRSYQIKRTV